MSHVFESITDFQQQRQPAIELAEHPRKVIRDYLKDYCAMNCKRLSPQQVDMVVEVGMQCRDLGDSPAKAIEAGKAAADRLVQIMRELRTRYGTRPDPEAA